jgi:hypothetical protein
MSLQPAPEPERASSHSSAALTTSGDGGGATPGSPAGPFETELSNDNRLKGALHKLVLVLPPTILILEQALLHPDEKIKLPLVDLELRVHDITPIFLMLVCYMLYRALRYARIVLWTFSNSQEKMNTVGQIILDNTEAYKLNAACYEEVLDPMAAASVALWARWKPIWFRDLSWAAWGGFNVLKSLILYGFIFLLLVLLALYTSKEALSVVASRQLSPWQIRWFAEPTVGIDAIILCISSLMLLLAWSNAAATVLLAVWTVLIRILGLVVVSFRIPMRCLIRRLYRWAIEFRAQHREKTFATELSAYREQMERYVAERPDAAELRKRMQLYTATLSLEERFWRVTDYFGTITLGEDEYLIETSERRQLNELYGLESLTTARYYFLAIAHLALVDFVLGDGWKLYERLDDCIKSYEIRPQERIMIAINRMRFERQRQPTEAEKIWLRDELRARLDTIVSRKQDILSVKRNLHSTFLKLPRTSQADPGTYGALFEEEKAAEAYFTQPTSTGAKFPGRPPLPGSKDSKKVTLLLALIERVVDIPSIAAGS